MRHVEIFHFPSTAICFIDWLLLRLILLVKYIARVFFFVTNIKSSSSPFHLRCHTPSTWSSCTNIPFFLKRALLLRLQLLCPFHLLGIFPLFTIESRESGAACNCDEVLPLALPYPINLENSNLTNTRFFDVNNPVTQARQGRGRLS